MDISHCINDLLLVNSQVCIPGLCTFVASTNPAEIQFGFGVAHPPSLKLVCKSDLKEDNDLLVKYISSVEKIDETEALTLVKDFVKSVKEKLNEGKNFYLEELGYFYAIAGRIDFKPAIGENLNLESFGLGKIKLPKAQHEIKPEPASMPDTSPDTSSKTVNEPSKIALKQKKEPVPSLSLKEIKPEKPVKEVVKSGGTLKWILIGIFVPLLVALILFFAWFKDLSTIFEPKTIVENKTTKEKDTTNIVEKQIEEQTIKQNALLYTDTVVRKQPVTLDEKYAHFKNFYIIAGSFKNPENAKRMQSKLLKGGFPNPTILPNGNMYRVIIQKFSTHQKAMDEMVKLQGKGMNVWILSL